MYVLNKSGIRAILFYLLEGQLRLSYDPLTPNLIMRIIMKLGIHRK